MPARAELRGTADADAAMNDMAERIREFLSRYDACIIAAETPPPEWLGEAMALLRQAERR
jgi:hypothetical protein